MGVMHQCNFPGCKKKFDRKYNLKCHLRIHSNEKPYRCHHPHCTRSFRWKSSLNHHLMSLDHTPAAARRERKARAAKRRKQQLAAAPADQISLEPTSARGRSATSPASSDNFGSDNAVQDDCYVFGGQAKRDIVRSLDWSETCLISGQSSPCSVINSDMEYLNRAQMRMRRAEHRVDDLPLAHAICVERHQELLLNQLTVAGLRHPPDAFRGPCQVLLPHVHMTPAAGLEGKPYQPHITVTGPRQVVSPSSQLLKLRDDSSLDSAIDHAMNCMVSPYGVKNETMEAGMPKMRDPVVPELNVTHLHGDWRDGPFGNRGQDLSSKFKSQVPLVSVSEDSSHAIIHDAFSPAADRIFAPCGIDPASLTGF